MPTANLGDIAFGVVADTTRLAQALTQIRNFGNAVDQIAARQAAAGQSMDAMWSKQENAIIRATVAQERFNASLKAAGAPAALISANVSAFNKAISDLTGTASPLTKLDFSRSINELSAAMAKNKLDFTEWKDETKNAGGVAEGFVGAMEKIARAAQLITGPLSGAAFRITLLAEMMKEGTLASTALISGFAGAAFAFFKLGESATAAATAMVPIQNQIKAVSGTALQTQLDLQFVMETADRFGLKFQDLARQFAGLATAARGTRLEGQGIRTMFEQLAAVSGTLTLSEEKMAGMFQEVERLLSMGIVQWRNLRELSRDIPNIYELISKTIGTDTVAALEKFLRLGTQASDVILPRLISQIVKAYGIDVAQRVDNVVAAHERFNNALFRFNTALDATVGFSERAMRTYDALRGLLDFLSANMDKVAKIAIVAAGAVAGLVAGYIITGFGRLAAAIIEVGKAIATMNLLAAGSPITILIRLAAAVAGAYVGYEALDKIVGQFNTSILTSKTQIEDYIKAWDTAKTGFSSNTDTMLKDLKALQTAAEAELKGTKTQIQDLEDQYVKLNAQLDENKPKTWGEALMGASGDLSSRVAAIRSQMDALVSVQTKQITDVEKYKNLELDLLRVKQQQLAAEKAMPGIKPGDNDAVIRMKEAQEKLNTALQGVQEEWMAVSQGPYELQKAFEDAKINKQIESMRDSLEKAGYDFDRVSQAFRNPEIDKNFKLWAEDLRNVANLKLFEKNFIEPWKVARDIIQTGMTQAFDGLITALQKGKVQWQDLGKVAIDVLNMIIKKLLEVAVIAPIIDALFGTGTSATKPLGLGGAAPGGLIGALLKSFAPGVNPGTGPGAGQSSATYIQHGGGMSSVGFFPSAMFTGAPRLHDGLAAGEYPAILQRGETVTPRGQSPGGSPVTINIAHPSGTEANVQRDNTGGLDTYNIVITQVQKAMSTGRLDMNVGGRYGFRPAGIRR